MMRGLIAVGRVRVGRHVVHVTGLKFEPERIGGPVVSTAVAVTHTGLISDLAITIVALCAGEDAHQSQGEIEIHYEQLQ